MKTDADVIQNHHCTEKGDLCCRRNLSTLNRANREKSSTMGSSSTNRDWASKAVSEK